MVLAPTVVLTSLVWLRDNAEFTETEVLEKIADIISQCLCRRKIPIIPDRSPSEDN